MNSGIRRPPLSLRNIVTQRADFSLYIDRLDIRAGEIACVVGPNGGGKTTLLLTVLGLLPHEGSCYISGRLYDGTQPTLKAQIGFIPDDPDLVFEGLTAKEQWSVTRSVLQTARVGLTPKSLMERTDQLARQINFTPPPAPAGAYSHGMRKKTQIVNALISSPQLIVIDELRNGLDPLAIKETELLIKKERDRGAAILVATHDLWWAERFADYIFILDKGHVVAAGSLKELLQPGDHLEDFFFRTVELHYE